MLRRQRLRRCQVVEGGHDRRLDEFLEEAAGRRDGVRSLRISRHLPLRLDRDHQRIVGSVVAPLELQDSSPVRDGPREAHREERRIEARHRELEPVDVEAPTHVVRERACVDGLEAEDRAGRHALPHRPREDGMAVARDERAERHVKIGVFVAVRVPNPRALRLADVERVRVDQPVVAVHPERDVLLRGLPGPCGLLRPPLERLELCLPRLHVIVESPLERSDTINGFPTANRDTNIARPCERTGGRRAVNLKQG